MSTVRLKIDVSGTVGDEAWRSITQYDQIQSAAFGPRFGSGGPCNHPTDAPHAKGEWVGAEIRLRWIDGVLRLAEERVLDADVVD